MVPVCGVISGVGKGASRGRMGMLCLLGDPIQGDGCNARSIGLVGVGVREIVQISVGVAALRAEQGGSISRTGRGGGLISEPGELYPESLAKSADPKSKLSSSGVSSGTMDFQVWTGDGQDLGVFTWADGEYLRTIATQRWNTGSGMCSFQLTALRKALSFWLISQVLSPDILLQARAE